MPEWSQREAVTGWRPCSPAHCLELAGVNGERVDTSAVANPRKTGPLVRRDRALPVTRSGAGRGERDTIRPHAAEGETATGMTRSTAIGSP